MRQDEIELHEVWVRTVRPGVGPTCQYSIRECHSLGSSNCCGDRLRLGGVSAERWLARIGWHATALHCAASGRWMGWSYLQGQQRLFLLVKQSRFLQLSAECPLNCVRG